MQQRRIKITGRPRRQINLDLLAEAMVTISEQNRAPSQHAPGSPGDLSKKAAS